MHIILSFIPPPDLYPFRFVNRSFHVLVEPLMEQWVRNRDEKLVSQLGEEAAKRELFTSFDLDSGLYSDVFVSWSDLARNRYLYEQLVPSCCTRESLVALESSRLHRGEFPRVKITMLGDIRSGKSMFCCPVILGREYDNLATIGAGYCSASFAMGSEENRIRLDIWDTAGHPRNEPLYGMYVRSSRILVFMVLLESGSREWLQRLHTQYYSTNLKCVAIGTWKDKKKDNRTSYDVISYCVRNQIPYYECDLRLHEQMLRVLYAIMYYGHFQ